MTDMLEALKDAALQIEYLHDKFQETGSGNSVLSGIRAAIAAAEAEPVNMKRADGWVVCLAANESRQYEHYTDWREALNAYDEPPRGWSSLAICPAIDGVPFAKFPPHTIAAMRAER